MVHIAANGIEAGGARDGMEAGIESLFDLRPEADAGPEAKNRFHDAVSAFMAKD